jgi:hypothetical protein
MKQVLCASVITLLLASCGGQLDASKSVGGASHSLSHTPAKELKLRFQGEERSLPADWLGYNVNTTRGPSWTDADFRSATAALKPRTLRYPAGDVGNYWDWRSGWYLTNLQPPYSTTKPASGAPVINKLEHFKLALDATGAKPVFMLNVLTSTLEEQLAMLRHARDLGMPVDYVELGNEFYIDVNASYLKRFPTPADYASEANQWIAAINAEFPEARVAVIGADVKPQSGTRRRSWNGVMTEQVQGADAITIHPYQGSGLPAGSTFSPTDVPLMLSQPFSTWETLAGTDLAALPDDLEVWLTEYNLNDNRVPVHGTWAHGLYVAAQTLTYLRDERITLVNNHSLVTTALFGALFNNATGFALGGYKSIDPTLATKRLGRTAGGETMALLAEAMTGTSTAQELAFAGSPALPSGHPAVWGWAFRGGMERRGIVLNLSEQTIDILPEPTFPGGARFRQLTADPTVPVTGFPGIISEASDTTSGHLTLAPYSITYLTWAPAN